MSELGTWTWSFHGNGLVVFVRETPSPESRRRLVNFHYGLKGCVMRHTGFRFDDHSRIAIGSLSELSPRIAIVVRLRVSLSLVHLVFVARVAQGSGIVIRSVFMSAGPAVESRAMETSAAEAIHPFAMAALCGERKEEMIKRTRNMRERNKDIAACTGNKSL